MKVYWFVCLKLSKYVKIKKSKNERVYGKFCIETLHERRKRKRQFNGLFV